LYGMSEYLMLMHEVQKARLADLARKVETEPGEIYEVIRHEPRIPEAKARFGLEARNRAGSKGAEV
jgi:hypothetical protein